jgi:hypothetical protein
MLPEVQISREVGMSIDQTKNQVVARIWQSIAESGVSVSAIPQEQMSTLVNAIADGVLLAVDSMFEEAGLPAMQEAAAAPAPGAPAQGAAAPAAAATAAPPGAPAQPDEEQVLWEGRPFLSIATYYRITNQRVRIIHGLLGRERDDIELIRIQDLDIKQSLGERFLNVGDIIMRSADPSYPDVRLNNVRFVDEVHEILRKAMLQARRKYRYSIQERI